MRFILPVVLIDRPLKKTGWDDIHGGRGRVCQGVEDVCRWWGGRAGVRGSGEVEEEEEEEEEGKEYG